MVPQMAKSTYRRPVTDAERAERAERQDARRAELQATLQDGIDNLVTSDGWADYLRVQSKFHRYSFGNTLLILRQRPDATQVAGYRKWPELNRYVKGPDAETGEKQHAIWIWGPCTRKETDPDTGERRSVLFAFKPVPVFDIAQTDGEPLPEPVRLVAGEDDAGHLARLVKIAEAAGYPVSFVPEIADHPGSNGVTRWEPVRAIEVATAGRDPLQQVKTMCHELGHAFLHVPGSADAVATMTAGMRELEAESVAFITAGTLGVDTSAYSFGYVAGWSGGDAKAAREAIRSHGERIQKAAKRILDALEATETADVTAEYLDAVDNGRIRYDREVYADTLARHVAAIGGGDDGE